MRLSFNVAAILVAGLVALPAAARTHHRTERHHAVERHATTRHEKTEHGRETDHRRAADRHHGKEETRAASPAGVTRIPAGGLKVFCAGRSGPLLIRKATQGNGTTVTVICR